MKKLKTALINQLRKRVTDPANRGGSKTNSFSGDDSTVDFNLSETPVNYISGVSTVNSGSQTLNSGYFVDFGSTNASGTVTLNAAPMSGDTLSIEYVHGVNWVYSDEPRADSKMPRMSLINVGGERPVRGAGGQEQVLRMSFRVQFYVRSDKSYSIDGEVYSGDKLLDYLNTELEEAVVAVKREGDVAGLVDLDLTSPNYLGLDEEYKIKRTEATLTVDYWKEY